MDLNTKSSSDLLKEKLSLQSLDLAASDILQPQVIATPPSLEVMELKGALSLAQLEIERLRKKLVLESARDFEEMPDLN